jgi:hypothetical protein
MTTRQYARLVADWIAGIGLDPHLFGTHSLRRTKATLIYRRTGNLRAVQLLLGHTKMESTVRYLGIEVDDALAIAEQVEVRAERTWLCPIVTDPLCQQRKSLRMPQRRVCKIGKSSCCAQSCLGFALSGIRAPQKTGTPLPYVADEPAEG